MTLYLKYRPQTIDELDLPEVRASLTKILGAQNLPHAFLFSGPKGTGKTSAARILAKIINCEKLAINHRPSTIMEPCNKCSQCVSITKGNNMDVIELDAASNRGIDDIRSLKENIMLAPTAAKKKIYIIDEAHMLTTEASNAFLKTLEEPPAHVVFILATTNPEKLPETVLSRLTRVDFSKATSKDIARQLARVAKGEKIKITTQAIELIAKKSDGSFRDAVKIMESLILHTTDIKEKDVENILHTDSKVQESFFKILKNGEVKVALELVENAIKNGSSLKLFLTEITESIHESLLAKNGLGEDTLPDFKVEELVKLIELLQVASAEIAFSPIPQLPLEIAIIKFMSSLSSRLPVPLAGAKPRDPSTVTDPETKQRDSSTKVGMTKTLTGSSVLPENWQKILQTVGTQNPSIEGLLRAAEPIGVNGKILTIGVYYRFHKEKLESPNLKNILQKVICEIIGDTEMNVDFLLTERKQNNHVSSNEEPMVVSEVEPLTPKVDTDIINAAKEIFGS